MKIYDVMSYLHSIKPCDEIHLLFHHFLEDNHQHQLYRFLPSADHVFCMGHFLQAMDGWPVDQIKLLAGRKALKYLDYNIHRLCGT